MTYALAQGGREFFGWGQDRHLRADLYDAIVFNTQATGQWKGKPPAIPNWPRPTAKAEKKRTTVKDLWYSLSKRR